MWPTTTRNRRSRTMPGREHGWDVFEPEPALRVCGPIASRNPRGRGRETIEVGRQGQVEVRSLVGEAIDVVLEVASADIHAELDHGSQAEMVVSPLQVSGKTTGVLITAMSQCCRRDRPIESCVGYSFWMTHISRPPTSR